MKYYKLNRKEDITGNSGTGHVAEVVVGGPGTAIVLWSGDTNALGTSSIVVYETLADLVKVHGHGGSTVLEEAELTEERKAELQHRLQIAERKIKEVLFGSYGSAISFHSGAA